MRLMVALFSATALAAVTALTQPAFADERNDNLRRSIGNLRPSQSPAASSVDGLLQGLRADHGLNEGQLPSEGNQRHRPYYGWGRRHRYRPVPPGYGYDPFHRYPHYPRYLPYDYWYPYPPPLYIPAEALYGPQAVKRFFGIGQVSPPAAVPQVIVLSKDEEGDPAGEPIRRASNQRSINLGWRFIGFGDGHFSNQKYADAYQRYKRAAQVAPTLADPYFRQGCALIALGNHDQAAKVFKRGLEMEPAWAHSGFRLDELYGNNRPAKAAHLNALAQAAIDEPNSADLLFLVGVFLHFDGQTDRAKPFFQEAARLAHGNDAHLKAFLQPVAQPDEE